MNAEAYLHRIGYQGPLEPTVDVLRQLHRNHMYAVPFENLDVTLGRPIVLSLPSLFEKIVMRRRGGFCYELNALFSWLLQEIGFKVEMLSGRVFNGGVPGAEFDHMLLLLDTGAKLIADVGFGDSFIEPIHFCPEEQIQHGHSYRLVERDDKWILHQRAPRSESKPQYIFSLKPRQIDDFRTMCHYHQTSPDSVFTSKSVCSLATRKGRITLANDRLIVTSESDRQERLIVSAEQYQAVLQVHFGIDLGDEVDTEILMHQNTPPN